MGEKVQVGPVAYTVLQADWRDTLTDAGAGSSSAGRYLVLRLSMSNSGGQEVTVPTLTLKGSGDNTYPEVTEGLSGIGDWLGIFRRLEPNQTEEGRIFFEAPVGTYKLQVSDGADVETERTADIDIPPPLETPVH